MFDRKPFFDGFTKSKIPEIPLMAVAGYFLVKGIVAKTLKVSVGFLHPFKCKALIANCKEHLLNYSIPNLGDK